MWYQLQKDSNSKDYLSYETSVLFLNTRADGKGFNNSGSLNLIEWKLSDVQLIPVIGNKVNITEALVSESKRQRRTLQVVSYDTSFGSGNNTLGKKETLMPGES